VQFNEPSLQLQVLHQFLPVPLPDQPCSTVVAIEVPSKSLHACSRLKKQRSLPKQKTHVGHLSSWVVLKKKT
jgi:hypothetical protein